MKTNRALLLLLAAAAAMIVANGRFGIAAAAWIAPALLVRFMRTQPALRAFLGGALVMSVAAFFWWLEIMPARGALYVVASVVFGVVALIPYLADRALAPRIGGLAGTLVLPSALVTLDYAASQVSPFGTWGAIAYTQSSVLPLVQLVSLTGLSGLTFLIIWFASVANAGWTANRRVVVVYAVVLAAVMLFGGLRLLFASTDGVVRFAAITPRVPTYTLRGPDTNRPIRDALRSVFQRRVMTPAQLEAFRRRATEIQSELLDASEREARNGAKLVFWSEGAGIVEARDEAALIAKGAEIARRTSSYIGLSFLTLNASAPERYENKNVLLDASGNVAWQFHKAHPVPGMEACAPGDGRVPVAATPFGRIATVICFDMDFPPLLRQAGKARADIVLCPADDWREIDPLHTQMAVFRAVEQGFSLVRATSSGLSIAVDRFGRVYAAQDYFAGARILAGEIPRSGGPTIYTRAGDVVAWGSAVLLIALVAIGARSARLRK